MQLETTDEIIGIKEIAELLGVVRGTVDAWRWRGVLVEPDGAASGRPLWHRDTILEWARQTGRL